MDRLSVKRWKDIELQCFGNTFAIGLGNGSRLQFQPLPRRALERALVCCAGFTFFNFSLLLRIDPLGNEPEVLRSYLACALKSDGRIDTDANIRSTIGEGLEVVEQPELAAVASLSETTLCHRRGCILCVWISPGWPLIRRRICRIYHQNC